MDCSYTADKEDPAYTNVVEIDLSAIEPNLSGPKRPQDLIPLSQMKKLSMKQSMHLWVTKVSA